MKKQKISNFFRSLGYEYHDMEIGKFYPIDEWEILSRNLDGDNCWKKVTHIVRKESCVPIIVSFSGKTLYVSPEHVFWTKIGETEGWLEALDLVEETGISLLQECGDWVSATFLAGDDEIEILDLAVEDTSCYFSEGVLSHNTMFGDPMVTSGGKAIPYHSSVRIKLGAGSQILNKDKEVIGINVSAKTIKNKVSAPFRKCDFEIHFGKGIREHEQLFDFLRKHGAAEVGENIISIDGTGSWKALTVADGKTGEIKIEKKFYKSDFDQILIDPEFKPYLDGLIETAFVKKSAPNENMDIDTESYEEVRAVSMDLEDVLEDLEG